MSSSTLALTTPAPTTLTIAELTELVSRLAADPTAWRPRLQLPAEGADRWWTLLSADDAVDVWLLSWLPGHRTDPHDHGASAAAFTVVLGELDEVRAEPDGVATTQRRRTGSVATVPVGHIHDVRAVGTAAASIHAYSPPLTAMTYYQGDRQGRLRPTHTTLYDPTAATEESHDD